jgi:integrase
MSHLLVFPLDPFTLDEIEQILKSCSLQIRALIQFAFWTGLRTSELIALEWRDVSLKDKTAWTPALAAAGVEYRRPYQTRQPMPPNCSHWV